MEVENEFEQLVKKFNIPTRPDPSELSRRCWGCGQPFVTRITEQRYCTPKCKAKKKPPPPPPQAPKINYDAYLLSEDWRNKSHEAKRRAGFRCQVCNRGTDQVLQLEAHHRTYENLGDEKPSDITVLCNECHGLFEQAKKQRKKAERADPRNWVAKETKHEKRLKREKSDRAWRRKK